MTVINHAAGPVAGILEIQGELGRDLPYHYTLNLAQFVRLSQGPGTNRVEMITGGSFAISDADADALKSVLLQP